MKSKKNRITHKYKSKKNGGGAIAAAAEKLTNNSKPKYDTKCTMESIRTSKGMKFFREISPKKLKRKMENNGLFKNEKNKIYVNQFLTPLFNNYCIKKDKKKNLKLCINMMDCIPDGSNLVETFYKLFNPNKMDKKYIFELKRFADELKELDSIFKNANSDIDYKIKKEKLKKEILVKVQNEYIGSFSEFLVEVIIRSIKEYETDHAPKSIELDVRKSLYKIFKKLGFEGFEEEYYSSNLSNIVSVTTDDLVKKLKENNTPDIITKLYSGKDDKEKDTDENFDINRKQSGFYIFFITGLLSLSLLLSFDVFDTPESSDD